VAREVDGRVQLRVLEEHPEREDHHEADVAQQRRQVPKSTPCEYSEYPVSTQSTPLEQSRT
jgi:hypothetical protein